jgi:hypothetical protein
MNGNQSVLEALKFNLNMTSTAPGDHPLVQAIERRFAMDQGMTDHPDPAMYFAVCHMRRALAHNHLPSGVVLEGIYPEGAIQTPQIRVELHCSIRDDRRLHCDTFHVFGSAPLYGTSPVSVKILFGDTSEDSPRLVKEDLHDQRYQ